MLLLEQLHVNETGGEAIADQHSVADEESARAVVQTALDAWGRVDILVNNAGVGVVAGFDEITPADIWTLISVHLMGAIWMCRAVWPHLQAAGYGRIVNTTSGGMLGNRASLAHVVRSVPSLVDVPPYQHGFALAGQALAESGR